jgi:hypothetical protein
MIEINAEYMTLTVEDKVIATAQFRQHAAGERQRRVGRLDLSRSSPWPRSRDRGANSGRTHRERLPGRRPHRSRAPSGAAVTDRLIRITTALAVVAVAGVAAIISYQHAYELVTSH